MNVRPVFLFFLFEFRVSCRTIDDGEYIRAPGRAPRLCMPRKEPVPGSRERKEEKERKKKGYHVDPSSPSPRIDWPVLFITLDTYNMFANLHDQFVFCFFCVLAAIYITGRTVHVVYPGGGRRLVGEFSGLCLLRNMLVPVGYFVFFALICSGPWCLLRCQFSLSLSLSLQRRRTSLLGGHGPIMPSVEMIGNLSTRGMFQRENQAEAK